jgi:autotransporter-associated beta strand protein
MKPKTPIRHFLALAGSSLLAITYASAGTYYWDSDGDGTAGFGSATGTWGAAGTGNKWSTSPTGDGVGGASVADYATQAGDDLNFGTPTITYTGATTINGTVLASRVYQQSSHPTFVAGAAPKIDFGAAGIYETSGPNRGFPASGMEVTGTQITWKSVRNLEIMNVTSTVGKTILSTGSEATISYPGRVKMRAEANLGAANAPLVFDHGTLSMQAGFPYTSLSALHAAHPVSFVANKNAGLDNSTGGTTFTVDLPIDLGTGVFYTETSGGGASIIKLTSTSNNWSELRMTTGILEISDLAQLGPISAPLRFGTGTTELNNGTLRITGTSVTSLGTKPLLTTSGKGVSFDIADAANTFTVDQPLDQGTGFFTKSGPGSLIINTTSTYTGLTTVAGGKLSFVTSAGLPTGAVTVNGADAVLDLEAYNPSVGAVTLANGSVTGSGTLTGSSFTLNGVSPANITIGVKLAGSGAMAKNNSGTATLSADNSAFSGAVTISSSGVLNINSTTALGTGAVTISGGTIDASAGAITLSTANAITLGGNFTFGGSNPLNLGTGAITRAAGRTITLNGTGSTLGFGGLLTNTQAGNPTLTANGAGNTLVLGGLALSGPTDTSNRTVTISGTANTTINGAVTSGGNGTVTASLLTKTGTGTLTLNGNNTYDGNTTVTAGCLALVGGSQNSAITVNNGAFLGFTLGQSTTSTNAVTLSPGHKVRITGTPTPGTSYTLLTTSATISGTPEMETPIAGYDLVVEGSNTLVLKFLSDPFQDWAFLKGLDGTTAGKENGKNDDPDGDGKTNLFEFAFNGNPLNGSDNGMIAGLVQDASAPAGNELTLVIAVRDGATFASSGSPVVQTATIDGVTYTIEGTLDLVTIPGSDVSHAAGPSNTAPPATGLPDLTGTAWEYHTFKLDASEGLGGKGFLRAKAE